MNIQESNSKSWSTQIGKMTTTLKKNSDRKWMNQKFLIKFIKILIEIPEFWYNISSKILLEFLFLPEYQLEF